jgi:hypothetical protein
MLARIHRTGLFSVVQRVVIGTMIIAGAGIFPATLFSADKAADKVVEKAGRTGGLRIPVVQHARSSFRKSGIHGFCSSISRAVNRRRCRTLPR